MQKGHQIGSLKNRTLLFSSNYIRLGTRPVSRIVRMDWVMNPSFSSTHANVESKKAQSLN